MRKDTLFRIACHTVIVYVKNDAVIRLYRVKEVDKITQKVHERIGYNTDAKTKA